MFIYKLISLLYKTFNQFVQHQGMEEEDEELDYLSALSEE